MLKLLVFSDSHGSFYEMKRVIAAHSDVDRVLFLGDGVPVYRSVIEEKCRVPFSFAPAHMARQRAASCAVLAEIFLREGVTETAEAHAPFYLRPSQAEQEKERARAAAENGGNGDKGRAKSREGSA